MKKYKHPAYEIDMFLIENIATSLLSGKHDKLEGNEEDFATDDFGY